MPVLRPVPRRVRGARFAAAFFAACALLGAGCSDLAFTLANLSAGSGEITRTPDLPYGSGPRQRLDVYAPRAARGAPVVVFWYGGAWVKGSKEDYRFVGAALAEAGYVVVLADYRLYPQAKFPDFLEDGARAVGWASAHARDYGGDPAKLFIAGHSAGAHLAAMLAVQPRWLQQAGVPQSAIRGLIGLSGPYALEPDSAALNAIFAPPFRPADWQPVALVRRGAPPALLLHGADDGVVWPAQAQQFAAALRGAGAEVELEIYPGRRHADTVAALSVPGRGRAPVLAAIERFVSARSGPSR